MEEIRKRVKIRLPEESNIELIDELIKTAIDRVCVRVGEATLPDSFKSITVEIVVKAYRRQYYEGISSEQVDTIGSTFFEDILGEYDKDFTRYLNQKAKKEQEEKGILRFI